MFPNGNVGLENSKFYEDVPARGHNACAGRHELQVPQITKRLHEDSARPMSLILKALPLATDDFRLGPRQSTRSSRQSFAIPGRDVPARPLTSNSSSTATNAGAGVDWLLEFRYWHKADEVALSVSGLKFGDKRTWLTAAQC